MWVEEHCQQGYYHAGLSTSNRPWKFIWYRVVTMYNVCACCEHALFCLVYRTLCEGAEVGDITERWYDDVKYCVQLV